MSEPTFSKAQVSEWFDSPIWTVICSRLSFQLQQIDSALDTPDQYMHGKMMGKREAYRMVLNMKEILEQEAKGESPYSKQSKNKE